MAFTDKLLPNGFTLRTLHPTNRPEKVFGVLYGVADDGGNINEPQKFADHNTATAALDNRSNANRKFVENCNDHRIYKLISIFTGREIGFVAVHMDGREPLYSSTLTETRIACGFDPARTAMFAKKLPDATQTEQPAKPARLSRRHAKQGEIKRKP